MDSRRDYSPWPHDAGLGSLWISDWDSARSDWATVFEHIINCCDKPTEYVKWMYRKSEYLMCLPTCSKQM